MSPTPGVSPINSANRLGLNYRHEATTLPWHGPIWDVHTHIQDVDAARIFFDAAATYGIEKIWSMSPLEEVDALRAEFGSRIEFIAIPNFAGRADPATFTTDWLDRIKKFAAKGSRMCKFWAAPRGRDFSPHLLLDAPIRLEAMKLAKSLGMIYMTHVGDPDTWFATMYKDSRRYGTKAQQYEPLERFLSEHGDVPWIAAHMGGDPEHLDHLQDMLDRHANLYLDCSATKWMVRELSKQPQELRGFLRRNAGRVLFGSDIVANRADMSFDLYASRYWALRTLMETEYEGQSPIVDPDLSLVDPKLPATSTAMLHGAHIEPATLAMLYRGAAQRLLGPLYPMG